MISEELDVNLNSVVQEVNNMDVRLASFSETLNEIISVMNNTIGSLDSADFEAIDFWEIKQLLVNRSSLLCNSLGPCLASLYKGNSLLVAQYYGVGEGYNQFFMNFFNAESQIGKESMQNVQFAAFEKLGININPETKAVDYIGSMLDLDENHPTVVKGLLESSKIKDALINQVMKGYGVKETNSGRVAIYGTNELIKEMYGGNIRVMSKAAFIQKSLTNGLNSATDTLLMKSSAGALGKFNVIAQASYYMYTNTTEYLVDGNLDKFVINSTMDLAKIPISVYIGEALAGGVGGVLATAGAPPVAVAIAGVTIVLVVTWGVCELIDTLKEPAADAWDWIGDSKNSIQDWGIGY